jgi:hypothetical protein
MPVRVVQEVDSRLDSFLNCDEEDTCMNLITQSPSKCKISLSLSLSLYHAPALSLYQRVSVYDYASSSYDAVHAVSVSR